MLTLWGLMHPFRTRSGPLRRGFVVAVVVTGSPAGDRGRRSQAYIADRVPEGAAAPDGYVGLAIDLLDGPGEALDEGGVTHLGACGVGGGDAQAVDPAVRQLVAQDILAVPAEVVLAALQVLQGLDVDNGASFVEHLDLHVLGLTVEAEDPVCGLVCEGRLVGDGAYFLTDQADGVGDAIAGGSDQLFQQVIGQQLLLDSCHLDDLLGEVARIHRGKGVLVLHLRRQQDQEGVEALGQPLSAHAAGGAGLAGVDGSGDHASSLDPNINASRRQAGLVGAGCRKRGVSLIGHTHCVLECAALPGLRVRGLISEPPATALILRRAERQSPGHIETGLLQGPQQFA